MPKGKKTEEEGEERKDNENIENIEDKKQERRLQGKVLLCANEGQNAYSSSEEREEEEEEDSVSLQDIMFLAACMDKLKEMGRNNRETMRQLMHKENEGSAEESNSQGQKEKPLPRAQEEKPQPSPSRQQHNVSSTGAGSLNPGPFYLNPNILAPTRGSREGPRVQEQGRQGAASGWQQNHQGNACCLYQHYGREQWVGGCQGYQHKAVGIPHERGHMGQHCCMMRGRSDGQDQHRAPSRGPVRATSFGRTKKWDP